MKPKTRKRRLFYLLLLFVSAAFSLVALVIPALAPLTSPTLQEGQVISQDILAPRDITYESELFTAQQREAAARAVANIYTATDTSVARRQLEDLRTALNFVTSVRADTFSTPEQKLADLAALENVHLSTETASAILALNDTRWQVVMQESIVVLEQIMRSTIRQERLDDARRSVPTLVSLSLPEDQASIVSELAAAFVAPNSTYSESLTEAARQKARDAVVPIMRSYKAGESVIQGGQVLTAADLEALQNMGLVQPEYGWRDLSGAAGMAFLSIAFSLLYLRRNKKLLKDTRGLTVIAMLYVVFLVGARLVVGEGLVIAYVFPLAAFSLTVTALFGAEPALIAMLPLAILAGYDLPNAFELTVYYILSSFFGVLTLGRGQRVMAFFWAGTVSGLCGATIAIIHHLPLTNVTWLEIAMLVGAALLNGIASASLTVLLQFFLAQFLGLTTALQLMEISRPDHPLLQLLLRNAPGTYQHSLQVANLAEQAAERIGADTLLTRVGALYHDVGKVKNTAFFIENQQPGSENPHDTLEPIASAQIIIQHVLDGMDLARDHRLPVRIQDFIIEHHGTLLTSYQYVTAVKAAGGDAEQVDKEAFRYPGPRPRSRETAILMLADGSEARVRAARPKDDAEVTEIIKAVIQDRLGAGQLDDTSLTLQDLNTIATSFATTLRGIYHPRIEYPRLEKSSPSKIESAPTVPVGARANTVKEAATESSLQSQESP